MREPSPSAVSAVAGPLLALLLVVPAHAAGALSSACAPFAEQAEAALEAGQVDRVGPVLDAAPEECAAEARMSALATAPDLHATARRAWDRSDWDSAETALRRLHELAPGARWIGRWAKRARAKARYARYKDARIEVRRLKGEVEGHSVSLEFTSRVDLTGSVPRLADVALGTPWADLGIRVGFLYVSAYWWMQATAEVAGRPVASTRFYLDHELTRLLRGRRGAFDVGAGLVLPPVNEVIQGLVGAGSSWSRYNFDLEPEREDGRERLAWLTAGPYAVVGLRLRLRGRLQLIASARVMYLVLHGANVSLSVGLASEFR